MQLTGISDWEMLSVQTLHTSLTNCGKTQMFVSCMLLQHTSHVVSILLMYGLYGWGGWPKAGLNHLWCPVHEDLRILQMFIVTFPPMQVLFL